MKSKFAIILGIASPLLAMQLVQGIIFVLNKLYDLMCDTNPTDATVVQAAIDLTSGHAAWVAVALALYVVYMVKTHARAASARVLSTAGWAAAVVTPASLYLLR